MLVLEDNISEIIDFNSLKGPTFLVWNLPLERMGPLN